MKLLDTEFKGKRSQKRWMFKQLERDGMYAIYEKRSESTVTYEVIEIQFQKAKVVKYPDGRVIEYDDMELYPGDEQFGLYGWAYNDLDAAYRKYLVLYYSVPETVSPLHNRGTQPV
jgi:hypothetical protein